MTFSSFIFYIADESDPCGCWGDCSCSQYRSYVESHYNVADAAEALAKRIKRENLGSIESIFVNGLKMPFSYDLNVIMNRKNSQKFVNPIRLDSVDDYFAEEVIKEASLPDIATTFALKALNEVFEATGPLVEEFFKDKSKSMQDAQDKRDEAIKARELEELDRLQKKYKTE